MKHHMRMFIILILLATGCGEGKVDSPQLPRPSPGAEFDAVAKRVIQNNAELLAKNPSDAKLWKKYGDVCLINGWPTEAVVAYSQAETLGDPEAGLMKAYSLRELNDSSAFSVAEDYFIQTQDQECGESIADWHFDDGSLAEAAAWLKRTNNLSVRGGSLSILINVQLGNFESAIKHTKRLLEQSQQPSVQALAAAVGQATQDGELLSQFGNIRGTNLIPMPPRLRDIQRLARTEVADVRRVIRIRTALQPEEGFQKIGPILRQRPNHPLIQSMGADLQYKMGKVEEAKVRLDRVRRQEISDYEFWLIDAVVNSEVHKKNRSESGPLSQADSSVQKALQLNPDVPEAHQIRAVIYEQQGNLHDAQMSFKTASELSKDDTQRVRMLTESFRCLALAGFETQALDQLEDLSAECEENIQAPRVEAAVIAFGLNDLDRFRKNFDLLDTDARIEVEQRIGRNPFQK